MKVCKTLEEVRHIKEECSLRYLSQTPEERKLESQRVIEWFEKRIGRPIEIVDNSKRRSEEMTQV